MKSLDSEWRERQCRSGGKMNMKQYDKLGYVLSRCQKDLRNLLGNPWEDGVGVGA